MTTQRTIRIALYIVAGLYAAVFAVRYAGYVAASNGYLYEPGHAFGGDFLNVYAAARLVLSSSWDAIYQPARFMAFQTTLVGEETGLRLWANPPQSLLFVWPFGLGEYHAMFAFWSATGLGVLVLGARRMGLGWPDVALLAFSPAALFCVTVGQTGNLACGLMLLAMSRRVSTGTSAVSASILTIKPQLGLLLPIIWLAQRRWRTILMTIAIVLGFGAVALIWLGTAAWRDYLTATLPLLSQLERDGDGTFAQIIPSLFMSMRLSGIDPTTAIRLHMVFAVCIVAAVIWLLVRTRSSRVQAATALVGTCLVTPYMHSYDLSLLLAGALIAYRASHSESSRGILLFGVIVSWALPAIIRQLADSGMPISPLLILGVLASIACAARKPQERDVSLNGDGARPGAVPGRM